MPADEPWVEGGNKETTMGEDNIINASRPCQDTPAGLSPLSSLLSRCLFLYFRRRSFLTPVEEEEEAGPESIGLNPLSRCFVHHSRLYLC